MQISVDTDELYKVGDGILSLKTEIENTLSQIEITVASLNGEWQGQAEIACENQIIFVKQQYSKLLSFFEECSETIKTCAERYNQYDAELTSKIQLV